MLSLMMALSGCAPAGSNTPECRYDAEILELDEVSELGFSAAEVLPVAQGERLGEVAWKRGTDAAIELSVGEATEIRFQRGELIGSSLGETDVYWSCPDFMEIDAPLTLGTDDGWFAESWAVTLRTEWPARLDLEHDFDPTDLAGSYELDEDLEMESWDDLRAWISLSFTEVQPLAGELGARVVEVADCDQEEDCVGESEWVTIGRFSLGQAW